MIDVADHWKVFPFYAVPGAAVLVWFLILTELVGGRFVDRIEPLAFLDLTIGEAVVPAVVFVIGAAGAWVWRRQPVLSIPCLGYTAWMVAYTTDILDGSAIIRVNVLPVVLGLLGLAALGTSSSPERPRTTPSTTASW